jgi:hypothetical protein
MALKIKVPIGTDRGITSEAYVRITDYNISKSGNAAFRLEIFQSQEVADDASSIATPAHRTGISSRNTQIGDVLNVSLMVEKQILVPSVRSSIEEVPVEKEIADTKDEEGNTLTSKTILMMERQVRTKTVDEVSTIKVPDLSSLENVNIFSYGYSNLKTKLSQLFGAENIVDC